MSNWKEDANHRRAVRQGITDQRAIGGRNGRDRPWAVYYRFTKAAGVFFFGNGKWLKMRAYRTKEEAEKAIEQYKRKHGFYEMRLEGPNV
mgnify:CR=1 FL=1